MDRKIIIVEILRQARTLLEEKGWAQGVAARDIDGKEVRYENPNAACYCITGAIAAAATRFYGTPSWCNMALTFMRVLLGDSLMWWNDQLERTKVEVLMAFDFAIMMAEEGL